MTNTVYVDALYWWSFMYRTISGTQINLVCSHLLAAQRQNLLEYLAILLSWAAVRQQGDSHRDTQTVKLCEHK